MPTGPLDLTSKNAAIIIIMLIIGLAAVAAVGTGFYSQLADLHSRFTTLAFETVGMLWLALSIDRFSRHDPPPPPAIPAGE